MRKNRRKVMAVKKVKKAVEVQSVAPAAEVKKVVAKKTKAAPVVATEPKVYVVIDHPQEAEIISGLHYAIRIGASDNGTVEISFDNGEWQSCRPSAGYWWFDWGYFTPGIHKISARLRDKDGKTLKKSLVVKCDVR
jgi:hypothetical protein